MLASADDYRFLYEKSYSYGARPPSSDPKIEETIFLVDDGWFILDSINSVSFHHKPKHIRWLSHLRIDNPQTRVDVPVDVCSLKSSPSPAAAGANWCSRSFTTTVRYGRSRGQNRWWLWDYVWNLWFKEVRLPEGFIRCLDMIWYDDDWPGMFKF